jgi:hypothetical protein
VDDNAEQLPEGLDDSAKRKFPGERFPSPLNWICAPQEAMKELGEQVYVITPSCFAGTLVCDARNPCPRSGRFAREGFRLKGAGRVVRVGPR